MSDVIIRPAKREDMVACSRTLYEWLQATEWMPKLHELDDMIEHGTGWVFDNRTIFVAEQHGEVVGSIVPSDDNFVTAFYINEHHRSQGIGSQLMERAQQERPAGLTLWTFVANTASHRFYQRHGFAEVERTDGNNEEGLPDIRFAWKSG